ncbi:hypothetical protein [Corynebacterium aquatimens]|uniref:GTPase-associated protein 1 N-terminal domain-containing protein n=1 Tax=Corynebacterium aquatimens TaxID=1190508 RepID=A0A931GUK9_9CORY|nr:hypothetical protein [Corynebacterium aquatimens]MBG6122895.1 hypothetical protein [Corynebacterium aquatimens]WJY66770.1 hypothetical protein CAQUA_10415 [Corynebacterium aquatimens]
MTPNQQYPEWEDPRGRNVPAPQGWGRNSEDDEFIDRIAKSGLDDSAPTEQFPVQPRREPAPQPPQHSDWNDPNWTSPDWNDTVWAEGVGEVVDKRLLEGPRWSQLTHASFGAPVGNGWGFGPSYDAWEGDVKFAQRYVRGSIQAEDVNDFLSEEQIEQLPVRFEYIPVEEKGLFLHSKPAGSDSTGRKGNTFTHAYIDHDTTEPSQLRYPVLAYGSPDFKTPFGSADVNSIELSHDDDGPNAGAFDLQWAWIVVRQMMAAEGVIYAVQDALEAGQLPVILTKTSVEATAWIMVLSCTMSVKEARSLLRFSTFERATSFEVRSFAAEVGRTVLAAPLDDDQAFRAITGVTVIDPRSGYRDYQPHSRWAQQTKLAITHFDPGGDGDVEALLDALDEVNTPDLGTLRLGAAMRLLHIDEPGTDEPGAGGFSDSGF